MKKSAWIIALGVLVALGLVAGSAIGASVGGKTGSGAYEQRMQDSFGMPLLRGDVWLKMDHDSKIAFIWGMGHVMTIEQELASKHPELKADDFSAKGVEAMSSMSINDVVAKVDSFYQANPDKAEIPVMRVVWDNVIKPNIKTGIAGRPLSK